MAAAVLPNWRALYMAHTLRRFSPDGFKQDFGVSLLVVTMIWAALPPEAITAAKVEPVHLMWLLHWLRHYLDWQQSAHHWRVSEKTYRVHVKDMLYVLHDNLNCIRLGTRFNAAPFEEVAYLVIDATVCPLQVNRKSWDEQAPYYSGRHKLHCLKYEIAVNWLTGALHWVAGGVFGSVGDLTLTRLAAFSVICCTASVCWQTRAISGNLRSGPRSRATLAICLHASCCGTSI